MTEGYWRVWRVNPPNPVKKKKKLKHRKCLERERAIVPESKFTHGERKSLHPSFYPNLSKTQLFTCLMDKPLPVAEDFMHRSEKETSATCEGGRARLVLLRRWPEPLRQREGKQWRSTMAGVRERVSEGGRVGERRVLWFLILRGRGRELLREAKLGQREKGKVSERGWGRG